MGCYPLWGARHAAASRIKVYTGGYFTALAGLFGAAAGCSVAKILRLRVSVRLRHDKLDRGVLRGVIA